MTDRAQAGPGQRYAAARKVFFDRVVANAAGLGVEQYVVVGEGYAAGDEAGAGGRWWSYGADVRDVARSLVDDGFEPDAAARFLFPQAARMSSEDLSHLLHEVRSVAAPGARLALCGRPAPSASGGQPHPEDPGKALAGSRWRTVKISDRAEKVGFVLALPRWEPAPPEQGATRGALGRFCEWAFHRSGTATLAGHLATTYGVEVGVTEELDVGTFRVDLAGQRAWVARVFPASRPLAQARHDADILGQLRAMGLPAERCPVDEPVSCLDGQAVLVTEFAPGPQVKAGPAGFTVLGDLLGRLHEARLSGPAALRPGGAWHHLALDATPAEEIEVLRALMAKARHRVPRREVDMYGRLVEAVEHADPCADLPCATVHPDLVPRNVIGHPGKELTVIDWTGMGWGPRAVSLGCMLWAAGNDRAVDAAISAYCATVRLTDAEIGRLEAAIALRPLVLACWSFVTGRETLEWAARFWRMQRARATRTARRVEEGLSGAAG